MKNLLLFLAAISAILRVHGQDTLTPPQNVQAEVFNNSITLYWASPPVNSDYLSWENGFISNSIGLSSGGTFSVAAKWEPQQIPAFVGEQIEKVSIHTASENVSYTLKVWKGINAESLILSQEIDGLIPNQWSDVVLDSAVEIDPDVPVWVGYEVDQPAGEFPASIDTGPAFEGFGDLIFYEGEWITLSYFGLSNNWSIRVYTTGDGEQPARLPSAIPNRIAENGHEGINPFKMNEIPEAPESQADLLGYNIYADGEQINQQLVTLNSYYAGTFDPGIYTFGVTAVYDEGESEPAELTLEIGGGFLTFDPASLDLEIPSGEITEIPVTATNPGASEIDWNGSEFQPWLSLSETEGTIQPGSSGEFSFIIDATNLEPGYYFADVIFTFNNTVVPQSYYFISIFVEGEPEISFSPDALDFGDVETGSTKTLSFQIFNEGFATVNVDSIISGSSAFQVNNQSFELYPWEHTTIAVVFAPDSLTSYESEIMIYTDFNVEALTVAVSGSGTLASPAFLNAQIINGNDAELSWLPPDGAQGTTLSWDNGENYTAVGLGAGGTFYYGAKWTPEFLAEADGQTALTVSFFPTGEESSYTLKIYSGQNAQNLILSQPVTQYDPYEWTSVNIDNPFEINGSEELWVTFEVNNAQGEYPGGVDAGPAVEGFGDLISLDGVTWESMGQDYFLPYNWNIRLFASDQIAASEPVPVPRSNVAIENPMTPVVDESYRNTGIQINPDMPQGTSALNFEFLGYNVYRNDVKINDELVTSLTFTDPGLENGIYEYGVTAVYDAGESPKVTDVLQVGTPEISFNPESLTVELDAGEITTDTITIFNSGNVDLVWEAESNANFVIPEETSGTIPSGESQELAVTVDATFIGGGTINTLINFSINNLNNPLVNYPVIVTVQGIPDLYIYDQEINFGNVSPGTTKNRTLSIANFGFGDAEIFDFAIDNDAFEVADSMYSIAPYENFQLPVTFTPDEVGSFEGTLTFSTTSPNLPLVTIELAGNGFLMPPLVLSADTINNNVELNWLPPDGGEGNYLQYDNGENFQSIGLTGGGTFAVAAKWEPDQLISNTGNFVSAIGFYPTTEISNFTIKIWKGNNSDSLVVSQPVTDYNPYEWNDFFLSNPVEIQENTTYWLGYEVDQPDQEFPAGTDAGPAVSGFGDLVSLDGQTWESLSSYGLDFNWNIRAFVSETDSGLQPATPIVSSTQYQNSGVLVKNSTKFFKQNTLKSGNRTELLGYNIYRDSVLLNTDPVQETSFVDEGPDFGVYSYWVTALYDAGESDPAGPVEVVVEEPVQMPEGWQHAHTSIAHIIYVPTGNALSGTPIMEEGDWIGAFYNNNGMEYCAGAAEWHNGDTLKVVAFGDDPQTTHKEGFTNGEHITWKAYMHNTSESHELEVSYHSGMPNHDGTFNEFGLSMLLSINLIPTGFGDISQSDLVVYPNPGNGLFFISAPDNVRKVMVYNLSGQVVYEKSTESSTVDLNLTGMNRGTYLIKIETESGKLVSEKLIIK